MELWFFVFYEKYIEIRVAKINTAERFSEAQGGESAQ